MVFINKRAFSIWSVKKHFYNAIKLQEHQSCCNKFFSPLDPCSDRHEFTTMLMLTFRELKDISILLFVWRIIYLQFQMSFYLNQMHFCSHGEALLMFFVSILQVPLEQNFYWKDTSLNTQVLNVFLLKSFVSTFMARIFHKQTAINRYVNTPQHHKRSFRTLKFVNIMLISESILKAWDLTDCCLKLSIKRDMFDI